MSLWIRLCNHTYTHTCKTLHYLHSSPELHESLQPHHGPIQSMARDQAPSSRSTYAYLCMTLLGKPPDQRGLMDNSCNDGSLILADGSQGCCCYESRDRL